MIYLPFRQASPLIEKSPLGISQGVIKVTDYSAVFVTVIPWQYILAFVNPNSSSVASPL